MAVSPDPDQLAERARQIAEALQAIRADSPDATFTELEDAVDTALSELRRDLLAAQVAAHPLRDFRGAAAPPQCPDCGAALWAIGQAQRTVVTQGDEVLTITRTRGRCSACGRELFPPG